MSAEDCCPRPALTRRQLVGNALVGAAAAALPRVPASAATLSPIPTQQIGAIAINDINAMNRFGKWLGRMQNYDLIYFNQNSWPELQNSIPYIVSIGKKVLAAGRKAYWSVPVGGWNAYEVVRDGKQDALYKSMAQQILAIYPADTSRICIRLPWEFNGDFQSMRAKNIAGLWDGVLYQKAFRRIVSLFRAVSSRFYFDWCPNIGTCGYAPGLCYPGDDVVDVISLDVYYQKQWDNTGQKDGGLSIFNYRKTQPYGLDWLYNTATSHGKLIGIAEWGVDDNTAAIFTAKMAAWIKAVGSRLSHHSYWDRTEAINCQISTGALPAIGSAYKAAFAKA
jgi:hypothetical protein